MNRLLLDRPWNVWAWVFGVALILYAYSETLRPLAAIWGDYRRQLDTYGLFAVAAATWIAVREWRRGGVAVLDPTFSGAAALCLLSLGWFLAGLVNVNVVQMICVAFMLIVLPRALFGGWKAPRMIWAAVLLLLAIPMWGGLGALLQYLTAVVSTEFLRVFGLLAAREGYTIFVPAGTFQVDSGCSGLSQVLASLVVGALIAYSLGVSRWAALAFLGLAGVAAALGNILRVCTVVWIGNATQMQSPIVREHGWVGLVFFSIVLVLLLVIALRKLPRENAPTPAAVTSAPKKRRFLEGRLGLTLMAVICGPVLAAFHTDEETSVGVVDLPHTLGAWQATERSTDLWRPRFIGADAQAQQTFMAPGEPAVQIHVARYHTQAQGAEAVSDDNQVADPRLWWPLSMGEVEVPGLDGATRRVSEIRLRSESGERIVWRWYLVGGTVAGNGYMAKALNLLHTLHGDTEIYTVLVQTPVDGTVQQARDRLRRFVAEGWPTLQSSLHASN